MAHMPRPAYGLGAMCRQGSSLLTRSPRQVIPRRQVRRPIVFTLVYGVVLMVVGVTATAQSIIVAAHFTGTTMNAIVGSDAATVRTFVNTVLVAEDVTPGAVVTAKRTAEVAGAIGLLTERAQLLHLEVRAPDGRVLFSEDPQAVGRIAEMTPAFMAAAAGDPQASIETSGSGAHVSPERSEALGAALETGSVVREFLPLTVDEQTLAVVGLWRDAVPVLAQLDATRSSVVALTLAGALVVSVILFFVFRAAQTRISRQARQLVDASRRDPLTDLLNHGALVALLADLVEAGRATGAVTGIALLDIDNFRLLNSTHGHRHGDEALQHVAGALVSIGTADIAVGRFGPDEFIMVASGPAAGEILPAIERVRTHLAGVSLEPDGAEPLPVTVSVGLAFAPTHASSATELLSAAAVTLTEAKSGGGDTVRTAQTTAESMRATARNSYTVLRGLVLAVDA
jgi:diguanylate cyclase (GGDEF)-like protein